MRTLSACSASRTSATSTPLSSAPAWADRALVRSSAPATRADHGGGERISTINGSMDTTRPVRVRPGRQGFVPLRLQRRRFRVFVARGRKLEDPR